MYDCAQSAITFNNINLPNYDIHSKQARQQILFNFHKLTQSFVIISSKHIQKSKQQNQRINKLKDRILICKERLAQFQTTKQAIIFVSPGQYPKKYKFDPENNVSIFKEYLRKTQVNKLDMSAHYQVKHQIQKLGQQSKLKINELNNFVVFMLGQIQGKKKTIFQKSLHPSKRKQYTLGQIPTGVQYMDSLLLFNSHINPYRKYQITNNVITKKTQTIKNKQVQQVQKNQILVDRQLVNYQKPRYQQESIQFIRQQKDLQMPDFDLDLGLDGIVNYDNFTTSFNDFSLDNVQKKIIPQDPYANKNRSEASIGSSNNINSQQSGSNNILPPPPSMPNYANLPPPPSLGNLLPPPPPPPPIGFVTPAPFGNLPPPPPLGNLLPPPPLGSLLPPPPLGNLLPPPPLGNLLPPPSLPNFNPSTSSGGGRSALLKQLQNPNPLARLKKTITIQKGGVNPTSTQPPSGTSNSGQQKPAKQMSFMQALQAKIKRRFDILNLQQEQD